MSWKSSCSNAANTSWRCGVTNGDSMRAWII
ncbi:hypothetical protein NC652_035021 [Populus alba x Populus x berolinensis]|nr:hypothetical protein NC652_035021 [Populus alba x Populus x berolinensis]